MLFAGSVAKYNKITGCGQKSKVRVIGFDPGTAAAASKRYFQEAYRAADRVIESGLYSLYLTKWAAGDKEAQYQNMVDMFFGASSPESLSVKEYKHPDLAHGYDSYNIPRQLLGGNGHSAGTRPVHACEQLGDGVAQT